VHAADLHVDSPLVGLERYEGAPVEAVRGATRRALANLVDLCIAEEAAFLLLAGDIFDGDWKDYGTGLYFVAQMARLRQAGIQVFLIRGNHDAASQVTRHLQLPDNVRELGSRRPETVVQEALGVAIHGQSFASRVVTDDLAAGYPAAVPGLLNVGLLHTSAEGRPGHEPYAPCALSTLVDRGYDYWALGHVHAREVLAQRPWIVFPGNLQGRQAREAGEKGATLVSVISGRITSVEARALDVLRWHPCRVDASLATDPAGAIELVRPALERAVALGDRRLVAAPVTLTVRASVHRRLRADDERAVNELRALALDVAGGQLWIEQVRFVCAADDEAPAASADVLDGLVASARAARGDADELARLGEGLAELRRRLPAELREGDEGLRLDDPATLARLVAEAEALVVGRLGGAPVNVGLGREAAGATELEEPKRATDEPRGWTGGRGA
jgi:hypothetical protein